MWCLVRLKAFLLSSPSRALAAGALWTSICAVTTLTLPAREHLSVGPLAVVAGGWAWILLLALGKLRRERDARVAEVVEAMREGIYAMAEKLGEQMHSARAELSTADQLLGDAIESLITAFNTAVDQAHAGSDGIADEGGFGALAERVAFDVNSAVTALQFRDMVGQKLGHVCDKMVVAEETMYEIRLLLNDNAETAPRHVAVRVLELLQGLQHISATTPVKQHRIKAGAIELF